MQTVGEIMKLNFSNKKIKISLGDAAIFLISKKSYQKIIKNQKSDLDQSLKTALGNNFRSILKYRGFTANQGELLEIRPLDREAIILIGFENSTDENYRQLLDKIRTLGSLTIETAERNRYKRLLIHADELLISNHSSSKFNSKDTFLDKHEPLEAFIEALLLTPYRYQRFKSKKHPSKSLKQITILGNLPDDKNFLARLNHICDSVAFARDLINTPPNELRPTHLATICKQVTKELGLSLQLYDNKKLSSLGAGGILCVGMGSDDQSYLARISYKPKGIKARKKVALVGKAITFDTGGYVLKTSMETMKCDMSGGAAVLATIKAIAKLNLAIEVTAFIPIAENMISGCAVRPGDIYTLLNGKTVEVLNTDAEGRLILADALTLAQQSKPDAIIDIATLTGACGVALGSKYAGLFSNNDTLADQLIEAGNVSGEGYWRMPLANEYRKLIYSTVADYKNLFKEAGAITASLFLQEFVGKVPWAHLDIASPAFTQVSDGYIKAGGVGFGVRTLVRLLEKLALDKT